MSVHFVDIGGIVDHHSPFTFSFHKTIDFEVFVLPTGKYLNKPCRSQ